MALLLLRIKVAFSSGDKAAWIAFGKSINCGFKTAAARWRLETSVSSKGKALANLVWGAGASVDL